MDPYTERAHLLALLATHYPARMYLDDRAEAGYDYVVSLGLPTGQANWHVAERDLGLFNHVPDGEPNWDGHSTEEKYESIKNLVGQRITDRFRSCRHLSHGTAP